MTTAHTLFLAAALLVVGGAWGPALGADEARILISDDAYRTLVAGASSCRLDQDLISAAQVRVIDAGGAGVDAVTVRLELDVNVSGAAAHFMGLVGPTPCVVLAARGASGPLVVRQAEDGSLAVLVDGPGPRHLSLLLAAPQGFPEGIRRLSMTLPHAAALDLGVDLASGTVLLGGEPGLAPAAGPPGRSLWQGPARAGQVLRMAWAPAVSATAREASLVVEVDDVGVRGRLVLVPPADAPSVRVVVPEGCVAGQEPGHTLTRVGPVAVIAGPRDAPRWSAVLDWPRNVLDAVGTDAVLNLPLPRVEGVPLAVRVRGVRGLVPLAEFLQIHGGTVVPERPAPDGRSVEGAAALVEGGPASAVLPFRVERPSLRDARPVVRRVHAACAVADDATAPLVHVRLFVDNEQDPTLVVTDLEPRRVVGAWSAGTRVTPMAHTSSTTATVVPLTFFGSAAVPAAGVVDLYYRGDAGARPTFTLAGVRDLPAAAPRIPGLEGGLLDLFSQGLAGELRSTPQEAVLLDVVSSDGTVSFVDVPSGATAEAKPAPPSAPTTTTPALLGGPVPLGLVGSVERWALVPPAQGLTGPFVVSVSLVRPVHRRVGSFLLFLGGLLFVVVLVAPTDTARLRALGLGAVAVLAGVVAAPPLGAEGLSALAGGAVVALLAALVVFAVRPDPVEEVRP